MVAEAIRRCVSEQAGLGGFSTAGLDLTTAFWEMAMLDHVDGGSMSHLSRAQVGLPIANQRGLNRAIGDLTTLILGMRTNPDLPWWDTLNHETMYETIKEFDLSSLNIKCGANLGRLNKANGLQAALAFQKTGTPGINPKPAKW
ncbi:hypothetical protein MMC31_007832, partial [Peltigera leucophlebia]|nr:hypothetical protein [Peltigera leucophlebia]